MAIYTDVFRGLDGLNLPFRHARRKDFAGLAADLKGQRQEEQTEKGPDHVGKNRLAGEFAAKRGLRRSSASRF